VRLFAGERIYKILDRLGTVDEEGNEEPIEAKMLSKQIEKAQKKVEEQHFLMRKHTLEYDDVANEQRKTIYALRNELLEWRDMREPARAQIAELIERLVAEYTASDYVEDWDIDGLLRRIGEVFGPSAIEVDPALIEREELTERLQEEALSRYDRREQELSPQLMRDLERYLLLEIIDQRWREHLYDLDYLQQGIGLRAAAQEEPLVAYKNEAFSLFGDLMNNIWSDFAQMIFHVEVVVEGQNGDGAGPSPVPQRPSASSSSTGGGRVSYSGAAQAQGALAMAAAAGAEEMAAEPSHVEQRRVDESRQVGRNDPCWCGSGRKYKKCHGA
jgi:preprotein translocase subunit SecA